MSKRRSIAERAAAAEAQARLAKARTEVSLHRQAQRVLKHASPSGPLALGDYKSVSRPRLTGAWVPTLTSGDYHLDPITLAKLRGFCQRGVRNQPVARAIVHRTADLAIGTGLAPKARSRDADWNRKAETFFWQWADRYADARGRASFGLLQHQAVLAWKTDGDVGVYFAPTATARRGGVPAAEGSPHDLCRVQLIEADRIVSPPAKSGRARANVTQGVQLDALSRPIAYHVAPYLPFGMGVDPSNGQWVAAEDFTLLLHATRPSQTRGEPVLAALIVLLEQLDKYVEAEVVAAALSACVSLIVKTENPTLSGLNPLGADVPVAALYGSDSATASQRWNKFEPGMIRHLRPGEDVEMLNPARPAPQLPEFIKAQLKLAAADVGLPYELLLLDFSDTNFHASRSALGIAWRKMQIIQQVVIEQLCRPAWERVIGAAIRTGALDAIDDWDQVEWLAPGRPVIDPQREAAAAKTMVENNFATRAQVCAEFGRDFADVAIDRAQEKAQEIALGILPPTTPGAAVQVDPAADVPATDTPGPDNADV